MDGKMIPGLYDECKRIEFRDFRDEANYTEPISIHDCMYQVRVSCYYNQKKKFTYRYDYTNDKEILRQAEKTPNFDLSPMIQGQIDSVMQNQKILEVHLYKDEKYKDLEIVFENGSQVCYHGKHFVSFYRDFLESYKPLEEAKKIEVSAKNQDPYIIQKA